MPNTHLATYLNDHLAGAVSVLELLENLAAAYAGTEIQHFAEELRADIAADRGELEGLMARLDVSQSATRKGSAWLAEKFAQLKLRLDDPAGGAFRLLETTDALAVGIEGKRSLWRSLAAASENVPDLRGFDYARLERRAEDQRSRVESVRLTAAKTALVPSA